jgi:hypothetical protein
MPDQDEQPQELELPIEWYVPESVSSQYVTNMIVQYTEHEFVISFFDTKPPLIIGVPSKEALQNLKSIRAECVARIIVSPDRMPGFVNALQTNLENSLSRRASKQIVEEK